MSKHHKRNKPKRKRRIKGGTVQEVSNSIGEILLDSNSFEKDLEIHQTPFGEIKTHDGILAYTLRNKGVLLELLSMGEEVDEEDIIGRLVFFEKLSGKYPNEPYIAYEISECYRDLNKLDKTEELIIKNYEKYKGYPFIDISYVILKYDDYKEDVVGEVFGESLNLHEIYPKFKAFDTSVVADFYFIQGMIKKKNDQLEIAKNCVEVLNQVDDIKGIFLKKHIAFIEKPWLKWWSRLIILLILLVILGIIGGIIWGIIRVFQMIF